MKQFDRDKFVSRFRLSVPWTPNNMTSPACMVWSQQHWTVPAGQHMFRPNGKEEIGSTTKVRTSNPHGMRNELSRPHFVHRCSIEDNSGSSLNATATIAPNQNRTAEREDRCIKRLTRLFVCWFFHLVVANGVQREMFIEEERFCKFATTVFMIIFWLVETDRRSITIRLTPTPRPTDYPKLNGACACVWCSTYEYQEERQYSTQA
jgi:hypothetical protein